MTKYNKSKIMKEAWREYRSGNWSTFGMALKVAWNTAKSMPWAFSYEEPKTVSPEEKAAAEIRLAEIDSLLFYANMADRLSREDRNTIDRLNKEHNELTRIVRAA